MKPEDALRSDIHQALDPIAGSTPELLPRIVQRLRPVSRRRSYFAVGQVAAVLGILIVGAVVFNYLKTAAVGFTTYWQGLLGLILVVLVLALPSGIVGTLTQVTALVRKRLSR